MHADERAEHVAELVSDALEQLMTGALDYAESHRDAGDNYAHMPIEGWDRSRELAEFLSDNEVDTRGLDIDHIAELALDGFEMVSRQGYGAPPSYVFSCGSYAVGEIEEQIHVSELSARLDEDVTDTEMLDALDSLDVRLERGMLYLYASSDCYWSAEVSADELSELIADAAAE